MGEEIEDCYWFDKTKVMPLVVDGKNCLVPVDWLRDKDE